MPDFFFKWEVKKIFLTLTHLASEINAKYNTLDNIKINTLHLNYSINDFETYFYSKELKKGTNRRKD